MKREKGPKGKNSHPHPSPCGWDRESIFEFAEVAAKAAGCTPSDPLESVVERLGGKIEYKSPEYLKDKDAASIRVDKGGSFVIYLSPYTFPLRKRFNIAHELGHYVLHSNFGEKPLLATVIPCKNDDLAEDEAQWFAFAFLMPKEKLKKVKDQYEGNIFDIAAHFQVHPDALRERFKQFE